MFAFENVFKAAMLVRTSPSVANLTTTRLTLKTIVFVWKGLFGAKTMTVSLQLVDVQPHVEDR